MANTKISALSSASALDGTEQLAGVQGGANVAPTPAQLKTYCRYRADTLLPMPTGSATKNTTQSNHIVRAAAGIWYMFILSSDNSDLYYTKSINYGVSWATPISVRTGTVTGIASWFDKWTPADSGTVIHLSYTDSVTNTIYYRSLDTASDTLGTEITVLAATSVVIGANTCLSITKSKGGRILVGFDIDGGTETGFYKSDDYPVTAFTSKSNFNEGASTDYYQLFPANLADTADIWAMFWDRSATEITIKTYDDSLNDWTSIAESTAITGMTAVASTTVAPQFSGAIRNTDGHLMMVAWTNSDLAGATLRFWDVTNGGLIAAPVTIVTSTDDQGICAICVDTTSNDLYVFYLGKTDGSETAYTLVNVYYKISTDDGATWGAETQLSEAARGVYILTCSLETDSGDFAVAWVGTDASNVWNFRCGAWA